MKIGEVYLLTNDVPGLASFSGGCSVWKRAATMRPISLSLPGNPR